MSLREYIWHHLFNLAILWNFSDFYLGDMVATFFGLPIVFLGRLLYMTVAADYFYFFFILWFWLVSFVTLIGIKVVPSERFNKLLLPKIYGFTLSLFLIKTKFLNFFVLGALYNVIYALLMKYFVSKSLVSKFLQDTLELNFLWERFLLLFSVAISTGILTNFSYHILRLFSSVL